MELSYQDKIKELHRLCRQVSAKHGGDMAVWLEIYINDVIKNNKDDLMKPIEALRRLL